jgi:hypothetical protein
MARAAVQHRHDGAGAWRWRDDMGVLRRGGSVARRRGGVAQRERDMCGRLCVGLSASVWLGHDLKLIIPVG